MAKLSHTLRRALLWAALWAAPAFGGVIQYVDKTCATNGNGTAPECAESLNGTGAFTSFSSCTLASGNTCYICSTYNSTISPGNTSFTSGSAVISGACPGKPGILDGAGFTYGGSTRSNLTVEDFTVRNVANGFRVTGGTTTPSVNLKIQRMAFDRVTYGIIAQLPADATLTSPEFGDITCTNIGASLGEFSPDPGAWTALTVIATGTYRRPTTADFYVYKATTGGTTGASEPTWPASVGGTVSDGTVTWTKATPTGACIYINPAAQGVGAASGLVNTPWIHDINCTGRNDGGRYCIGIYPPDNTSTGGRVRGGLIEDVYLAGDFLFQGITVTNDADDVEITRVRVAPGATFGGGIIHTGGQGAPVVATTDGTHVHDVHNLCCAVANTYNPADGSAFYPDEGSRDGVWENFDGGRNVVATLYLNDANGGTFRGFVGSRNGDNCINLHGTSADNLFENFTCFATGDETASGFAPQGRDLIQVDATAGTGNTFRKYAVVGGASVPKCIDADVAITDENGLVRGCGVRSEGYTTDALDADPKFAGGAAPTTAAGFAPGAGSPLIGAGSTSSSFGDVWGDTFYTTPEIGGVRRDQCYRRGVDGSKDPARRIQTVQARCRGIPARYPEGL